MLFSSFFLCNISEAEDVQNGLVINISTAKEEYLILEPIILDFSINNYNSEIIMINIADIVTSLVITNSTGSKYRGGHLEGTYQELKFGKELKVSIKLLPHYGIYDSGNGLRYFPEDKYTINFDREVQSNKLELIINNSSGQEKQAFEMLSSSSQLQKAKYYELAYYGYTELISKYPQSIYSPIALKRQLFILRWINSDDEEKMRVCRKILDDYPSSTGTSLAIREIIKINLNRNSLDAAKFYFKEVLKRDNIPESLRNELTAELE